MKKILSNNKTVYIIGAGYSYDAFFPSQSEILPRVYRLNEDISGAPVKFITSVFGKKYFPSLEDIYSLLDRAISKRDNIGNYTFIELDSIRNALTRAIIYVIHSCGDQFSNNSSVKLEMIIEDQRKKNYSVNIMRSFLFYRTNAAYFIAKRIQNGIKSDPFSIISLNWDTLLEDSIYWCKQFIKNKFKIDVDYCCYTNTLTKDSSHTNSLIQKSHNNFNIKILKLHSSVNWLFCPNCNRLFTGLGSNQDSWSLYMQPFECPKCKLITVEDGKSPILAPNLISPTFLKNVDQTHINMVWHNAFVELSEANRIVIIGYSLPDSDFLLRTLFKRSISKTATIEVVLTRKDIYNENLKTELRKYFAFDRYNSFFSENPIVFKFSGVQNYFSRIHGLYNYGKILRRINQS